MLVAHKEKWRFLLGPHNLNWLDVYFASDTLLVKLQGLHKGVCICVYDFRVDRFVKDNQWGGGGGRGRAGGEVGGGGEDESHF